MVILLDGEASTRVVKLAIAVATYVLALLMVSTFRYWSFKEVDFARRRPVETLLVVVLSVMVVATMHEVFLFLVFGGYALSGPVRRVIVGRPPVPNGAESLGKDAPSSSLI
jgi:phosphatidylserine synthase